MLCRVAKEDKENLITNEQIQERLRDLLMMKVVNVITPSKRNCRGSDSGGRTSIKDDGTTWEETELQSKILR